MSETLQRNCQNKSLITDTVRTLFTEKNIPTVSDKYVKLPAVIIMVPDMGVRVFAISRIMATVRGAGVVGYSEQVIRHSNVWQHKQLAYATTQKLAV